MKAESLQEAVRLWLPEVTHVARNELVDEWVLWVGDEPVVFSGRELRRTATTGAHSLATLLQQRVHWATARQAVAAGFVR